MKSVTAQMITTLISCGVAYSQTAGVQTPEGTGFNGKAVRGGPHLPTTLEERRLATIRHILSSPTPIGSVQLERMGDHVAVFIAQVLQNRPPLSVTEQVTVVSVLHRAFGRPAAIMNRADRQPTAVEIVPDNANARPGAAPSRIDSEAYHALEAAYKQVYGVIGRITRAKSRSYCL